jgi:hypothetical protein
LPDLKGIDSWSGISPGCAGKNKTFLELKHGKRRTVDFYRRNKKRESPPPTGGELSLTRKG